MSVTSMINAKKRKFDEYYTQYEDIEKELQYYTEYFKDKIVYCNCDSENSNFVKYFRNNFERLGLKDLWYSILDMETGKGSFDSDDSIEKLKKADIIVTNPPFSMFRKYIDLLAKYNKKFIVLGNPSATCYLNVFNYIKNNYIWLGHKPINKKLYFNTTKEEQERLVRETKKGSNYTIVNGEIRAICKSCWYTNIGKRHYRELEFSEKEMEYKRYDNYDAINVNKLVDIPNLHNINIGVPITFMEYYNPDKFEIVDKLLSPVIDGKTIFKRIIIRIK